MVKRRTKTWQERREELLNKQAGLCLTFKQCRMLVEGSRAERERKRLVRLATKNILRASFRRLKEPEVFYDVIPIRPLCTIIADYGLEFDPMAFEEEFYFQVQVLNYYAHAPKLHNELEKELKQADPYVEAFLKERMEKDFHYFGMSGACNRSPCYTSGNCTCEKPIKAMFVQSQAQRQHLVNLSLKRKRTRRLLKY